MSEPRINIDASPWDLSTFQGRFKYFFWVTDPRLCFADDKALDEAKTLRNLYRQGQEPVNTELKEVLRAKQLYESAFHPDTGEKQNLFGRMCFQMPGGMAVTGIMLSFYRTNTAVIFWQWVNQSFNAVVNYTNRNANSPLTERQMTTAYLSATLAACFTAITLKTYLMRNATPFLQRYVPFAAVAAANCVNIPLMRQNEVTKGVDLLDANGNRVGTSSVAAVKGISQVIISRIIMCAPGMVLLPVIMETMCRRSRWIARNTWFHAPFQTLAVGCLLTEELNLKSLSVYMDLTLMVPAACAIYPQRSAIAVSTLRQYEPDAYKRLEENCGGNVPELVYYNKGL